MAEIKGKFIALAGILLSDKPELLEKANEQLVKKYGYTHQFIAYEDYYDSQIFSEFLVAYSTSQEQPEDALTYFGRRAIALLQRSSSFPGSISSVDELLKIQTEILEQNHHYEQLTWPSIVTSSAHSITIFAPAPEYDSRIFPGMWLELLEKSLKTTINIKELGGNAYRLTW